jgi:hypothetical protein
VGGGGPSSKNAQIVSAFSQGDEFAGGVTSSGAIFVDVLFSMFGSSPAKKPAPAPVDRETKIKRERELLAKRHPGFATARSVVLHRFSTEKDYPEFRGKLLGISEFLGVGAFTGFDGEEQALRGLSEGQQRDLSLLKMEALLPAQSLAGMGGNGRDGLFMVVSERNTPALFGSGKLDAIPDEVLTAAAKEKFAEFPEVTGRVAKLKDGRLGRFGWKAQKARLGDFVLTACAVELGLHVPGEPQSGLPQKSDYQAPGLDLNEQECRSLISFVASLPQPASRQGASDEERAYLDGGRKLFEATGCAACHRPKLGEVSEVYSDLLLHDMGPQLSDSGFYGSFVPNATEDDEMKQPLPTFAAQVEKPQKPVDESKLVGATRHEWRTPPLWGLRDSAPYLHDGRAATIEQAIALHGGEGVGAVKKFAKLNSDERLQLSLFLRSLSAPK